MIARPPGLSAERWRDMWRPDMSNVPQRIPVKRLLRRAVKRLFGRGEIRYPIAKLVDAHGAYGYRYGHYVLLAKDYIYGDVISAHMAAIGSAIQHGLPLLVYIGAADRFYTFDPEEVLRESEGENRKGTAAMVNFPIRLGRQFTPGVGMEPALPEKEGSGPMRGKWMDYLERKGG